MPIPTDRPPWWIWAAAATFLAYLSLMAWCGLKGPTETGITATFNHGEMIVTHVAPGSAAARAGLQPGDRLLTNNAYPIGSRFDWMALSANWDTVQHAELTLARGTLQSRVSLPLPARSWSTAGWHAQLAASMLWGARLFTLLVACFILWKARKFPIALLGAWFLASASVSSVVLLPGIGKAWRELPSLAGLMLWFPALSSLLLPAIFFSFLARFPRSGILRPVGWIAAWLPWTVIVAWFSGYLYRVIERPAAALGWMPAWFVPVYGVCSAIYLAAGVVIQVWNWRTLPGVSDRRCAQWLAVGSVVGWTASFPIILFDWQGAAASVAPAFFESRIALLSAALFLASLVVLSAIFLRRRVFGFRLMIRTGLRYALARRVLVSAVPACAVLLLLDLLLHSEQPLMAILQVRGQWYLVILALALFANSRREHWLRALDKRFFREQYEAQRILREIAETVNNAGTFDNAAQFVSAQVEQALHAQYAAIMTRNSGETEYRCVAISPGNEPPPAIPADGKLLSLVRALGKPMELSLNSSWLVDQLSPEEMEDAKRAHVELIVPITTGMGSVEAIMVAGPKRSEEPYAREDQELLSAIAASLALLLTHTPVQSHGSAGNLLRECLVCGSCFDSGSELCSNEGTPLTPRAVPRTLSGRYRLERRLGAGGMGTVYEALDTQLERRVAVKLIHDSLVGSVNAAARFRREARAAGGFSHPNIVTVYDFGVAAGTRAFLVMELLVGSSLRDALNASHRYPLPGSTMILRGVCDAVDTAHSRQLLHRDLKPENIFLVAADGEPIPKVLDFGLVKSISSDAETETMAVTQSGTAVGTLRYMAPELLAGESPQRTADLWALAVICFEMLTGEYPFDTTDTARWREAIISGRFKPLRDYLHDAPERLERFFASAFSCQPDRRPQSAHDFYIEVSEALALGATQARFTLPPQSPPPR